MGDDVEIRTEDPDQDDVRALLAESDDYFADLYPPEDNHLLDPDSLRGPHVRFYVARVDGAAVGCGAIVRHADGSAELKRMFVSPSGRGRKLGARLLATLEEAAAADGAACIRLETGNRQPEALGLYHAAGYREIGPFGDYVASPVSLFMEKRLK